MKTVAITGLSGVIGQILCEKLSKKVRIVDLYNRRKYDGPARIFKHVHLDLVDQKNISKILDKIKPDLIIHLAAKTHIDQCEKDKKSGKNGKVWKTNVEGTGKIAKFCSKNKIPLVFLSTECVFDGKKKTFSENSIKHPINWYGYTKNEAENLVVSSGAPFAILRSVVAYHENDKGKTIYGKFLTKLESGKPLYAVGDQLFTPTYTYDIVKAIECLISKELLGIYHVIPKKSLSPYEFALLVAKKNGFSSSLVKKTTLEVYYESKKSKLRLKNACLSGVRSRRLMKFTPKNPEDVL